MFFWGDWQVVVSVKSQAWDRFVSFAKESRIAFTDLGVATNEPGCLYGRSNGVRKRLRIVRNENFTSSAFNVSIKEHVEWLLRADLYESE